MAGHGASHNMSTQAHEKGRHTYTMLGTTICTKYRGHVRKSGVWTLLSASFRYDTCPPLLTSQFMHTPPTVRSELEPIVYLQLLHCTVCRLKYKGNTDLIISSLQHSSTHSSSYFLPQLLLHGKIPPDSSGKIEPWTDAEAECLLKYPQCSVRRRRRNPEEGENIQK